MGKNILNEYFDWMYGLVCSDDSYRKLLKYLHDIEFQYTIPLDGNRYEDGVDLRYRFGYEHGYSSGVIAEYLDITSCSVLEMMLALSIRIEEHIMDNPDIGNRTPKWFWSMIENLGISHMSNESFDREVADDIMDIFMNNAYEPNGRGGLFEIRDTDHDLRKVEIWYQACWYLNNLRERGEKHEGYV
jgi:hypothetical protein